MSSFSKKEAQVVRRSDLEYYSSLQTAASAMKLAQEEEMLSSNKTAEQLWKDKYEDHCNMQTELGK